MHNGQSDRRDHRLWRRGDRCNRRSCRDARADGRVAGHGARPPECRRTSPFAWTPGRLRLPRGRPRCAPVRILALHRTRDDDRHGRKTTRRSRVIPRAAITSLTTTFAVGMVLLIAAVLAIPGSIAKTKSRRPTPLRTDHHQQRQHDLLPSDHRRGLCSRVRLHDDKSGAHGARIVLPRS